ncbi:Heat shock protein 15 hslR [gamma proteobacterium HdN1]|nr:Heat shock protein 15 hslR [gamma proteobacterium HdN1]
MARQKIHTKADAKREIADENSHETSVRLDKWLWAARFYKTRGLSQEMIEGGKVHYDGHRVKASKEVRIGAEITLTQGLDRRTVIVLALTDKRSNATLAATLYEETAESIEKRTELSLQRKLLAESQPHSVGRPSKKQRRQIIRFSQAPSD